MGAVKDVTADKLRPVVQPFAEAYAANTVQRLYGFWMVWHLGGGREGLRKAGWTRSGVLRNRKDFERIFRVSVDDAWPDAAKALRKASGVKDVRDM
jgi:hypothetical protein